MEKNSTVKSVQANGTFDFQGKTFYKYEIQMENCDVVEYNSIIATQSNFIEVADVDYIFDTSKPKFPKTAKTKMLKQVAKKGAQTFAGRLVGGLAGAAGGFLAAGAMGAYKSGQKHSGGKVRKGQKSFMVEAKKKTKSIFKK